MKFTLILLSVLVLFSCDTSKLSETPISQFEGKWKIIDRPIWDNCTIEITQSGKEIKGFLHEMTDNKYIQLFADSGQTVISSIERKSNFEFFVTEKKVASELFSAYGQSTSNELIATFESQNKILLGKNGSDGSLERIK